MTSRSNEAGRGGDPRDTLGLPVDVAGVDEGQTRLSVHLVANLASGDAIGQVATHACKDVELLQLEQATTHLGLQLLLGDVLQH